MARYVQARSVRTREAVIEAAGERFAADGYTASAVADVAKTAGVAVGTLLFHFPAKAGIGTAVCDESDTRVQAALAESASVGDSLTRLADVFASDAVVRAGFRLHAESGKELVLSVGALQRMLIGHVIKLLSDRETRESFPASGEVEAYAKTIVSAFMGASALSALVSGGADLPGRVQAMWPFLCPPADRNGLQKKA